ncbi:MAG TPA: PilZ domain-containing protein [Anaeromyxobacter sp.]|nr:PilZ domain-containing protein [Anaeromyxobacter sp.]
MPDATIAPIEMTFLFGSVDGRARDVASFVRSLPDLSGGALGDCDLGASSRGDHFVALARLRAPLSDPAARRVDFWAWRAGGTPSRGSRQGRAALRTCDLVEREVAPARLAGAVRELLARHLGASADAATGRPTLRLALGSPELAGMAFDPVALTLLVPSPHLPPLHEPVALEVRLPGGATLAGQGVVRRVQAGGQLGPGTPAGFLLALLAPTPPLARALEAAAPGARAPEQRRAPRYALDAPASLATEGGDGAAAGDARVESLSQGGAFVSTSAPVAVGSRIRLRLSIPGGPGAGVGGTVVYGNERGLGIRFDADREGDAAIGTAIDHLATHPRRALVVDPDARARRALGAALEARGFEVFTAADGNDGLHSLIDLLLGLDLLVVDLHAPGLDGERLLRLVRDPGGERDLTIVVVGSEVDEAVRSRLVSAGADSVQQKGGGIAAVAEGAVATLRRRDAARRRPATAARASA